MKLHILETFTTGHVLDPGVKCGDILYIESQSVHNDPDYTHYMNWRMVFQEGTSGGAFTLSHKIKPWLTEQDIPQNPKEWNEEQMFLFQLRFS